MVGWSAHKALFLLNQKIMASSTLSLKIEFGGGLELLFSNQRSHKVSIPSHVPTSAQDAKSEQSQTRSGRPADITYLMYWLRDNLLKEREELFIENGTVYVFREL